jgi:hypothetical protein
MQNVEQAQTPALPQGPGGLVENSADQQTTPTGPGRWIAIMFLGTTILLACVAVMEFVLKLLR